MTGQNTNTLKRVSVAYCAGLAGLTTQGMLKQLKRMQPVSRELLWQPKPGGKWLVNLEALFGCVPAANDHELTELEARVAAMERKHAALVSRHVGLRNEAHRRLELVEQKQRALAEVQEAHRKLLMLG